MNNSPNFVDLVISINGERENEFRAQISKIFGHKTKTVLSEKLIVAINNALEANSTINPNSTKTMVVLLRALEDTQKEGQKALSKREKEVLSYLASGKTYNKIAELLFISVNTVRFHIKKIYRKYNIHSQAEAIVVAVKNGLI